MAYKTRFLPGFSTRLCGSNAISAASKLHAEAQQLYGLAAIIARYIPVDIFSLTEGNRDRIYTPWITFCAFLGQVLQRGASCQTAVRGVQVLYKKLHPGACVDDATGGYCQARARLSLDALKKAFLRIGQWCATRPRKEDLWRGRIVKVMDGCGLSMPDTAANRQLYPYASGQKPGCGFPVGQLLGLFSLGTGHMVRFVLTSWKLHEAPLARQLVPWINKGEVLLADRAFSNWGLLALFRRKEVDVVMRLHQARKVPTGRQLWRKPKEKPKYWEQATWDELPATLELRVVTFKVEIAGFRTEEISLVTTLLDEVVYPDAALADLFRRRWQVELFFRDIKTTLGLDVLRTMSPAMIEKEVYLQAIAYNLVRALMLEAAKQYELSPFRLSFKGTVSVLQAYSHLYNPNDKEAAACYMELLQALAAAPVPDRPNRSEPRAVKRRPKSYQLLTKPRKEMRVSASRRKKLPITPLN